MGFSQELRFQKVCSHFLSSLRALLKYHILEEVFLSSHCSQIRQAELWT